MDEMAKYVASRWKRDLIHIIGCCWAAQVGLLDDEGWWVAIEKFISVMIQWKKEWTEVKELMPLNYMPYVAKLFNEVTGKDLQGLSQFTGWIGMGGYYHWRIVQQGLIHLVPHLQDEPRLRTPKSRPSGQPLPPRMAPTGTPATEASAGQLGGAQPTPQGGGQRPTLNQGGGQGSASSQGGGSSTSNQRGSSSTPSQGGRSTAPSRGGKSSAPHQSSRPASTSGGATPTASGGPTDQPSGSRGAGNGPWASWYQMAMRESTSGISESQGPPFPIVPAPVRWEAVGQIYGRVDGKEPPASNIISRALRAFYTRVDLTTLHTWACQALCMIAEYHLACITRGSPVTSPILPGELEERFLPLTDYAPPEDRVGVTDVRVQDN